MIAYKEEKTLPSAELFALYSDAGWKTYTRDPEKLEAAVANSLYVLTARAGKQLVGLIRVVGDDQTIAYIQDILVLKSFQRQQIGSELFSRTMARFAHVRQKVLLTDDSPATHKFYEAQGFASCDQGQVVAFHQG